MKIAVGVQGSLFQWCESSLQANLRLTQAWSIGGIILTIPEEAMGARDTAGWLRAVAKSNIPPLHMPKEDMSRPPTRLQPVPEEDPVVETASTVVPQEWLYQPGCKSAPSRTRTRGGDSAHAPVYATVGMRVSGGITSVQSSPRTSPGRRATHTPALSAVGGARMSLALNEQEERSVTPISAPGDGFYVVFRGRSPWLYYEE